jgi:WD40 repeat protein
MPRSTDARAAAKPLRIAVLLWLATAAYAPSQEPQPAAPPGVRCLAFSPDGRTLAAAYSDQLTRGVLAAWDVQTHRPRYELREEVGFPSIAYSPDGQTLALARFAPEAKLLDAETGETIREFAGHADHARCVAFTPCGRKLITGSYDRTVKIWNAATGAEEATLEGHTGPVYAVAVSPDGRLLAAADARSHAARLWDLSARKELHAWESLGSLVPHVAFSPDGRLLAVSSWAGHLSLFDTSSYQPWLRLHRIGGVRWSAFSPDGKRLAVCTNGTSLYMFDVNTASDEETKNRVAELIAEFHNDSYEAREAAYEQLAEIGMPAEPQLVEAQNSESAEVRWRTRRLRERMTKRDSAIKLEGHAGELTCTCFSPDGRLLAAGDEEGQVTVWSVPDWKLATKLTLREE